MLSSSTARPDSIPLGKVTQRLFHHPPLSAPGCSQPPCITPCSVQPNPALFTHSSTWTAHGGTYHKMEFGVHHLAVKSVRYWIYMVFAEHIRRSSSSCLFKTAIIIQAVILSLVLLKKLFNISKPSLKTMFWLRD